MANAVPSWATLSKQGIILRRGAPGDWDGGMVECPVVWFDESRHRYGMVYTGYALKPDAVSKKFSYESVTSPQIGLAWSDDLLHWDKDEQNPLFGGSGVAGSTDSHGASGPFLFPPGASGVSDYILFYFGVTGEGYEGGLKSLNIARSTDLRNWYRSSLNPIITPGGHDDANKRWRSTAIWHPNVVRVGELYYCFFNASGEIGDFHEEFVGYATSSNLETWEVQDSRSPIVSGSRVAGRWDSSGRAGDPSVFRVGDTWWMAYYSWDNVHTQDGLQYTSDAEFPLGWRPLETNPILKFGPPGSFDSLHAGKPFVFRTKSTHYHFYTAVDDLEKREIAVATAPLRD